MTTVTDRPGNCLDGTVSFEERIGDFMKRMLTVLIFGAMTMVPGYASTIDLTLADLIGTFVPGDPANEALEQQRTNVLLGLYNEGKTYGYTDVIDVGGNDYTFTVLPGLDVPAPVLPLINGYYKPAVYDFPIPVPADYLYLLAKFGNQDAVYYLNGTSADSIGSIVSPFGANGGGLSHVTFFTAPGGGDVVPEPTTLLLLGSGLLGLVVYRKFRR